MPWQADLQTSMAGSELDRIEAHQREMLDAMWRPWLGSQASNLESIGAHQRELLGVGLHPWLGAQADIAKLGVAHLDVSRLEIQEGVRLPRFDLDLLVSSIEALVSEVEARQRDAAQLLRFDLQESISEFAVDGIGASQRELLGAAEWPRFDLQESISEFAVDGIGASQRELLGAAEWPRFDLQESISEFAVDGIGASQRELLGAAEWPRFDLQESISEFAVDGIGASQRELLDAMHRPLLESQAFLVDSVQSSCLAIQSDLLDAVRQPWLETPLIVDLPVPEPGIYTQDRRHRRSARQCATAPVDVTELATSESPVARLVYVQGVFADQFVDACLEDIRCSLEDGRPIAAVDRAHAAVHRMLQLLVEEHGREFDRHEGVPDLFRYLRKNHPAFLAAGNDELGVELLGKLGSLLQTLTEARNQRSLAHPTRHQLSSPWARFVVSSALTVFELLADLRAE